MTLTKLGCGVSGRCILARKFESFTCRHIQRPAASADRAFSLLPMFKVKTRSNAAQVAQAFEASARSIDKSTEAALNKAAQLALDAAPPEIKKAGYGFQPADVRKALRLERAGAGRLVARVVATGRPIALIRFDARQSSAGVSVQVLNGRKVIPGAFIQRMPSGHEGVYVRDLRRGPAPRTRANRWEALPVRELFGPSVPNGLANAKVQAGLQRLLQQRFPQLLQAQVIKPKASR